MEFRIADTFVDSLAKLNGQEQKAVKTTAFDLQMNPAHPGLQFHKLERAQDPNFASVRVNQDLRLILHRSGSSLLLCYVGHHEDAYRWAQRRKLETHPTTGAAQLVEVRETVQEILHPGYLSGEAAGYLVADRPSPAALPPKPPLFAGMPDEALLGYGVPPAWLGEVRRADEDSLLELADHLPAEAAEALLELATGGTPQAAQPAVPGEDPFEHPDAQRRFRVLKDVEELQRALEYPWEKWTVFLHPAQRQVATGEYQGPARVSGSAGTGKTIVALHRAVHLARSHPEARVLQATFSEPLARSLRQKLRILVGSQPRLLERLEVYAMDALGERLHRLNLGKARLAPAESLRAVLEQAAGRVPGLNFSSSFLWSEWEQVVDAWQLTTWEAYRDVLRLGRKTRLPENRRAALWQVFAQVWAELERQGWLTQAQIFSRLAELYASGRASPYEHIVVDEAQDISVPQLRFLAALAGNRPDGLFFAGDLGQRIFQQPFSWKTLGVDVRGRSRTLRVNYRTSHQIRRQADRLLGPEISDVDGLTETRRGTVSVFNGPPPGIAVFDTQEEEIQAVCAWLQARGEEGIQPGEIGVFVRSAAELPRAQRAVEAAGMPTQVVDEQAEAKGGAVSLSTMHLAKGLEFRAVAVMACDDEVIPLEERIEQAADEVELEEVYNTERQLLYVACTRARDVLMVSGVEPESEFVEDLKG